MGCQTGNGPHGHAHSNTTRDRRACHRLRVLRMRKTTAGHYLGPRTRARLPSAPLPTVCGRHCSWQPDSWPPRPLPTLGAVNAEGLKVVEAASYTARPNDDKLRASLHLATRFVAADAGSHPSLVRVCLPSRRRRTKPRPTRCGRHCTRRTLAADSGSCECRRTEGRRGGEPHSPP